MEIKQASQFVIKELNLITKLGKIDLKSIYDEINLFDSLLMPCMSGNIVLTDSVGLLDKLAIDGSEILQVNITKDGEEFPIKKAYRIYKLTDRKNINQTSELYILHFVSDEYIYSNQKKINQSYIDTYSNVVVNILMNELGVPVETMFGTFENSIGIKKIVIPNLSPIDAIRWCAKRAVDEQNLPNFIFFQNSLGYNFAKLSTLMQSDPLFDITFNVKNLEDNIGKELFGAKDIKVISQFDFIESQKRGIHSGKFIGFDLITRTFGSFDFSYGDTFVNQKHQNKNPTMPLVRNRENKTNFEMHDTRKSLYSFDLPRQNSEYIKKHDPESINLNDNQHNYIFQRNALLSNLTQRRLRIVMPGNFAFSSGFNLNLNVPLRSTMGESTDKIDQNLSGKYTILSTRHIIKYDRHETILEVVNDSSNKQSSSAYNIDPNEAIGYNYV
jgi:hypothetical protein